MQALRSEAQRHLRPRHLAGDVSQGLGSGIAAGDAADQGLQSLAATDALQIPHQGQAAIALAAPAEALPPLEAYLQFHGLPLIGKAAQLPAPLGLQAEALQTGDQQVDIAEHRRKDGEMGHGPDARFSRP